MMTSLPAINASLNALCALFLISGFVMIRRGNVNAHRACMALALLSSVLFLGSYLYYHAHVGHVRYTGVGFIRIVYFTILISHTILAAAIVPLVLRTVFLAIKSRFEEHRRWARWTLPLWMYVSVTGVVIYEMLY